jgi:hypothetical protein
MFVHQKLPFKVCRSLHDVVKNSLLLEYDLNLGFGCLQDGPTPDLSLLDRLRLLKEYRASWDSARWARESTLQQPEAGIYLDLLHGILLNWSQMCLVFRRLPSTYRCITEKTWSLDMSDRLPDLLTIDASQNLLILGEWDRTG